MNITPFKTVVAVFPDGEKLKEPLWATVVQLLSNGDLKVRTKPGRRFVVRRGGYKLVATPSTTMRDASSFMDAAASRIFLSFLAANRFDRFDCASPLDYRYLEPEIGRLMSERGFIDAKARVELELVRALQRRGACGMRAVREMEVASCFVEPQDVYDEEGKTKHDIVALVNVIKRMLGAAARRVIHRYATSYDIVDTANAYRFRKAMLEVVIPKLKTLLAVVSDITLREMKAVQTGRTHGQHAVPITFGFALANYVERLGRCIEHLEKRSNELVGKFSGAVGAFNATSLGVRDPFRFEREILAGLGLKPAGHSTQIAIPEPMARLMSEVALVMGVLADLANDMRQLQRTEIAEVGEDFLKDQHGSSTMKQKRNPVGFENAVSLWRIVMPRTVTVLMGLISEHQRDLTHSAASRTDPESVCYLFYMAKRLGSIMKKLRVNTTNMERNLKMQGDLILAEPLYIILSSLGHPDANEAVRKLTLQAEQEGITLMAAFQRDDSMKNYSKRMTREQRLILGNPRRYIGKAAVVARRVATRWQKRFGLAAGKS